MDREEKTAEEREGWGELGERRGKGGDCRKKKERAWYDEKGNGK